MNETLNILKTRRTVRSYEDKAVPEELIREITEAGEYAPTGMGRQSPVIIAITNKKVRDELSKLNGKIMGAPENVDPFYGAPVVLLVVAKKDIHTRVYDGSAVIDNMLNAAWSLGLGSGWIFRAKEEVETSLGREILQSVGLNPDEYEGIGHVIVGYVKGENPTPKPRKENYTRYIK